MAEKTQVFRKKSLERISSPEQLTDYLRVTTPGIWVFLAVIVVMIAGLFAWSVIGRLETVVDAKVSVSAGTAAVYVPDCDKPLTGCTVRIDGREYRIHSTGTDADGNTIAYADADIPDGTYSAGVVTESIPPVRFLLS
ncbi:MAG: hypothetical protein ILP19_07965 [Oscillospiraceae bacterium]|nr:hypothetical protein [Oscillospiraceae bacterium]